MSRTCGSGVARRLRSIRRIRIPLFGRLLLRMNHGNSREQKKRSGDHAQNPIPHTKVFNPFFSRAGCTDCVQAPKGCKGRMEISPGFFPPAVRSAGRRVDASATPPLGIVSFLLTPQVQRRKIRATFSADSWSRGRERKNRASIQMCARGESVQYLPGWTVQCINPECAARGHWLRAADSGGELCSNCSSPLRNVPPPISPRMRMRPRSLGSYRPPSRSPGRLR